MRQRKNNTNWLRRGSSILWASLAIFLSGCGVSANPFHIGNLPAGDIKRTHAKPPLQGFYRNFDPYAHTLTVTPLESINPVRKQHVLIATVCDDRGDGLRNRRVEWHLTGVGHIVEVDESGYFPGRGYLIDDKYAVSYTNYKSHVITRGNDDPSDDIHLKPGQTWCVITSAEEGDSFVTAYAPGIQNWDRHKVFAVKHWLDAEAVFPPPAVNPVGQPHPLVTKLLHKTDRSVAGGYIVRYRILDGPPAVFEQGGTNIAQVLTDGQGNGNVLLKQVQPIEGINRIQIEVIRPTNQPGGRELLIASSETTKTWVSPRLAIQKTAPPAVAVGQQIPFTIVVSNTGTVKSAGVTIRDSIDPAAIKLESSNPPAQVQGNNLVWQLPGLDIGQSATVQFVCTALAPGVITNCAEAVMAEGPSGRSCATTQVVQGALTIAKRGPATAILNQVIRFEIELKNIGNGPLTNIAMRDTFDEGLEHSSGQKVIETTIPAMAAGQTILYHVDLKATKVGKLCNRVQAIVPGGKPIGSEHCVEVAQPTIAITKSGPRFAIVGAPVDFEVSVRNTSNIPVGNVQVMDRIPPELSLISVPLNGQAQGNSVLYNIGVLAPGEQRTFRVNTVAQRIGANVCNVAQVIADGGVKEEAQHCLEIKGVPGLATELIDRLDPVAIGDETVYAIRITNQGSTEITNVVLNCKIPDGMEFVDAEGAVGHRYDAASRTLTFDPFPKIVIAEKKLGLTYQVKVRGARAGDQRFRINVMARELKEPVVQTESTQVYDPKTGDIGDNDGGAMKQPNAGDNTTSPASGSTKEPAPKARALQIEGVEPIPSGTSSATEGSKPKDAVPPALPGEKLKSEAALELPGLKLDLPPLPGSESEKKSAHGPDNGKPADKFVLPPRPVAPAKEGDGTKQPAKVLPDKVASNP